MIKHNILEIRKRILSACLRAKRDPASIGLVAVSKNRAVEEIKEAVSEGVTDFGENRVQEALLKYQAFPSVKWHMVGHLQTNKVKQAVKIFDLIQSVDSPRLAFEIDKEARKLNKVQEILLEIKISPEATKSGLKPEDLPGAIKECRFLKNIRVLGLMGIAPLIKEREEARPYFRLMRDLRDSVDSKMILSMGMTDDFEIAIEEGADMIRIGRAIFER